MILTTLALCLDVLDVGVSYLTLLSLSIMTVVLCPATASALRDNTGLSVVKI